jgi:hypothetical protein
MATALFTKDDKPPLSLEHNGFFSHQNLHYQMVPKDDVREISLTITGGEVKMASANPNIAKIGPVTGDTPWEPNLKILNFDEETEFIFKVYGKNVGRTAILVEDATGKSLSNLVVSVKQNIEKTYQLLILQDIKRKSKRSPEDLIQIMEGVKKLYKRQANVTLKQVYLPSIFYIEEDLGDPIDTKKSIWPFSKTLDEKINNGNSKIGATKQDFTIVSTWNLTLGDLDIAGIDPNFGKLMLAEDLGENTRDLEFSLFAHELAHAFNCKHHLDPPNLLMQLAIGSCKMSQLEIDTINQTGNKPNA